MNSQKEKPLISVVVPTHNRLGLLQEALDTVYAQEGIGELFEMEVIVVDDTPSEATLRAMNRYPGIQYIPLEASVFVSAARNVGIRASRGEYVALLDDDDLWLPHRLKAHVPALKTCPDAGVVYGQIIVKGDGPDTLWPDVRRAPSGSAFRAVLMEELVLPHSVMIRRDAFEKAGYFDENLRTMEHYDMFLRLAFHVPFAFIPGPVAIGRFSENGKWFTNIKSGGYARAVHFIVDRALNMLPDTPERTELRRQADSSWLSQIILWLEKAGQTDQARSHVLSALKRNPWMMTESWALAATAKTASRVARMIALSSDSPITAVRTFCADVRGSVDSCKLSEWFRLQWLLAYVWMEVGLALRKTGSPLQRRPAGHAASYAVLHNPAQLGRKPVWRLMIRGILASPRWDPIIAIFKKKNAE